MGWQDGTPVGDSQPAWMQGAPVNPPVKEAQPAPVAEPASLVDQFKRQLGLTARAGITGLTAIPGMLVDAPVRVANMMGADLPLPSDAQQRLMTSAGVPEPATPTERVAGNVASALSGTGGVARLGQSMTQSASPMVTRLGDVLQRSLGSQAAAATGGAAAAGVARENDVGPMGQLAAGFAGALAPGAAQATAARVISPNVRPQVRTMMDAGVTPTVGQLMGGRAQVTEDKLTSLPILGDAIVNAKNAGLDQFNRAVYQRALAPIGGDASTFPVGREGVRMVRDALGQAYDDVLGRVTPQVDRSFVQDLARINNGAMLTRPMREQFDRVLENQIFGKLTARPTGETVKEIESELSRLARGYRRDPSIDARNLGDAIEQVRGSIRQMLIRSNPAEAAELRAVDTGYANYVRLRDAAGRVGSREGVVTPAQLNAAVRNQSGGVGRGNYASGQAFMQDLSDAGMNVLGGKYPDSGTAGRIGLGALTAGGIGSIAPGALVGIGGASVPYLPGVRQGIAALMTQRPQGAANLADLLRPDSAAITRGALAAPYMQ